MSRLDEIEKAWQDMLLNCDGDLGAFYGWVGYDDIKWLIDRCCKLEKVREAAQKSALAFSPLIRKPGKEYPADELIKALKEAEEK